MGGGGGYLLFWSPEGGCRKNPGNIVAPVYIENITDKWEIFARNENFGLCNIQCKTTRTIRAELEFAQYYNLCSLLCRPTLAGLGPPLWARHVRSAYFG